MKYRRQRPVIITLLVVLLLCLCAVGCRGGAEDGKGTAEPVTPTGLALGADEVLTWQGDENAAGYVVSVDGTEYDTETPRMDLFTRMLQAKTYEIRVQAKGANGAASDWSEPIRHTVESSSAFGLRLIDDGAAYEIAAADKAKCRGKIVLPSQVPEDGKPITRVAAGAFRNCTGITGVVMSDSYTAIGQNAFYGCTGLVRVRCSSRCDTVGSFAFFNCSALTRINLAPGIDTIGTSAFQYCTALTGITLPDSLVKLGGGAFHGCASLEKIDIPRYVEEIGSTLVCECDSLVSVTVAEENPFFRSAGNCVIRRGDEEVVFGIQNSVIPADVRSIGPSAFSLCTGLEAITIPGNVEYIAQGAFHNCLRLTSVTLEEGIRRIGGNWNGSDSVFGMCLRLSSLEIPASVELIAAGLTDGCDSLTSLTVREGSSHYYGAGNCIICREDGVLVAGCKTSVIPDGVTAIGAYAFSHSVISGLDLPESVEIICTGAFQGSRLTRIGLSNTLRRIEGKAFSGCLALRSVCIPWSVRSIGAWAFEDCAILTAVLPGSVETIGSGAFSGVTVYTSAIEGDIPAGWYIRSAMAPGFDRNWAEYYCVVFGCTLGDDNGIPYVASLQATLDTTDADGVRQYGLPLQTNGLKAPVRSGYTFMGWATEEGSSTVALGKTEVTGKNGTYERTLPGDAVRELPTGTTLYAVWAPNA